MVYGYIYAIENSINDKLYVGQTINPDQRERAHFADSRFCGSRPIKSAIRKYGRKNFDFVLLERCEFIDQLNDREVYWIKELNTITPNGYNLTYGGDSYIPSDETRVKMSAWQKGKRLSEEHKRKISKSIKGRQVSDYTRQLKSLHSPYREKSACINGHEFTKYNTVIITRPDGRKYRRCRICKLEQSKRFYHKIRAGLISDD